MSKNKDTSRNYSLVQIVKMGNDKYKSYTDEELVRRIIATKDELMFAELYDRYANIIYNKGLNFTKSEEEAQDTTHDIFVKLFSKLTTFKEKSRFSTWLYAFVYNFYVNYAERNLNKRKKIFIHNQAYIEQATVEVTDEEVMSMKADKLAVALNKLNAEDKAILLMKYQDEFTIKEIQQVFDLGQSAVKMRLKRAKSKVVEIYNKL